MADEAPAAPVEKVKKAAKPKAAKVKHDHPKYNEMVLSAVTALKERTGSSLHAIKKYITEHFHDLPKNNDKLVTMTVKRMVANNHLAQVKGSYKLPPKEGAVSKKKPSAAKAAAKKPSAAAKAAVPKKKAATPKPKAKATPAKAKAADKPAKAKPAAKKAKAPPKKAKADAPKKKAAAAKKPEGVKKVRAAPKKRSTPKKAAAKK